MYIYSWSPWRHSFLLVFRVRSSIPLEYCFWRQSATNKQSCRLVHLKGSTHNVCVRVFGTVSSMKFDEWIGVSVLRNLCTWVGLCEIGGMWQVQHYQLSMLFWAMVARSCRPSNEQSLVDSEQLVETISRQGSIPCKFIPTRLQFIFFCHHWSTAHLSCLSDQKPDWIKLWIIWSDLQCHYARVLSCWPYSQPGERPGTRCALICLKACWMIRNSWGQKIEKLHQPERFKMGMLRCS